MGYVSISEALPIDVGVGATRTGKAGDALGDCAFARAKVKMTESNVRTEFIFDRAENVLEIGEESWSWCGEWLFMKGLEQTQSSAETSRNGTRGHFIIMLHSTHVTNTRIDTSPRIIAVWKEKCDVVHQRIRSAYPALLVDHV